MARQPELGLPPGIRLRPLDTGNYSLICDVLEDGKIRRLSQRAVLKTEPASYRDIGLAIEGAKRVRAFLDSNVDRRTTMVGFWERWIDEDHSRWGTAMTGRGHDTYEIYKSRTKTFIERNSDRQIATMVEQDIRDHLDHGGAPSQLATISMFFRDAMSDGLCKTNPAAELARKATQVATDRRRKIKRKTKPPQRDAIEQMLARAKAPGFPRSLYGWLLTGVRTGMRGAEIDGMRFTQIDDDVYDIDAQLHYRSRRLQDPKHGSFRKIHLPDDVLAEIERSRSENVIGSKYIWRNTFGDPWAEDARLGWWQWCTDGGPTLRSIVGGATMYQATRHHWAYYALNVMKIPPPDIAALYGHKDGGATLLEHYADVDNDAALDSVRKARAKQPVDLAARRRKRDAERAAQDSAQTNEESEA